MTDREKQRLRKRQLPESMLKLVKMDSNSFIPIIGTNGGNVK